MIKTSASKFKAKLGQYMRAVREGKEVQITDRDQPVARLIPIGVAEHRKQLPLWQARDPSAPSLGQMKVTGLSNRNTDTTAMLREDRNRR